MRRDAARREKKPFICAFVSLSVQLNIRSFDGFLDVLISFSTCGGSALQPVLFPITNFAFKYSLTFWGNQVEFVVLLIAHPIVRGALLISVEDKDVAEETDADGVDDVVGYKVASFLV